MAAAGGGDRLRPRPPVGPGAVPVGKRVDVFGENSGTRLGVACSHAGPLAVRCADVSCPAARGQFSGERVQPVDGYRLRLTELRAIQLMLLPVDSAVSRFGSLGQFTHFTRWRRCGVASPASPIRLVDRRIDKNFQPLRRDRLMSSVGVSSMVTVLR